MRLDQQDRDLGVLDATRDGSRDLILELGGGEADHLDLTDLGQVDATLERDHDRLPEAHRVAPDVDGQRVIDAQRVIEDGAGGVDGFVRGWGDECVAFACGDGPTWEARRGSGGAGKAREALGQRAGGDRHLSHAHDEQAAQEPVD